MDLLLLMLELVREELIHSSLYLMYGNLYQDLLVLLKLQLRFINLVSQKIITNLIMDQ